MKERLSRKIFAMILSFAVVFSMMPGAVFADAADSIADRCGPVHRAGRNQGGGRGGA